MGVITLVARRRASQLGRMETASPAPSPAAEESRAAPEAPPRTSQQTPRGEIGGPVGPDPTRYGDWERKGRCIDF